MSRPVLFVLAGVNGAGKSSIGGFMIEQEGFGWFNPGTFARDLVASHGWSQERANAAAWNEGYRRLKQAVERRRAYAFETTLGGESITSTLLNASRTSHDVVVWFCGLDSPERHISRVRARVAAGGHDIPEDRIRRRFDRSRQNLVRLIPHLAGLRVHDNSREAESGQPVLDPLLVLEMRDGKLAFPSALDAKSLAAVPSWAIPILEAAIRESTRRT